MYEVLLHPDAQKVYVNADKALGKKIARCFEQLEQTPRSHPNIKVRELPTLTWTTLYSVGFCNHGGVPQLRLSSEFWSYIPSYSRNG